MFSVASCFAIKCQLLCRVCFVLFSESGDYRASEIITEQDGDSIKLQPK